jgi:hypothetical protein
MSTHTILCGNCGTPVQGAENPQPNDDVQCSNCGQSDTYDAVVESAQAYVTDKLTNNFNNKLRDAVKGSSVLKFKPAHSPRREYRWTVADLDL